MEESAAIRLEGVSHRFGSVKALRDLTLTVARGKVFGFLGPNGAGKTTTIRILLGLLSPTEGHALVLGYDTQAQGDHVRERVGALLEHNGLYEQLTAEENLEFYARVWRLPEPERSARVRELLTHIGLWERRGERVKTWSKGMQQKLALARTILHRPAVVFLDEPTAGLDVIAARSVREDLASLAASEGVTVFLTTHNMSEAESLCSQVALIRQGVLVAQGSPDELRAKAGGMRLWVTGRGFTDPVQATIRAHPSVLGVGMEQDRLTVDLRQDVDSSEIVRLLFESGAEVSEVRKGTASLEDAFVGLMEEQS